MRFLSTHTASLLTAGVAIGMLSISTNAAIVNTNVVSSMEIKADQTVDASAFDSGATSANVSITGQTTGATAHSNLSFSSLTSNSATFNFDLGYNGNGYSGSGYMGGSSAGNSASINYFANQTEDLFIGWNFDYLGPQPFGLQIVQVGGTGPSFSLGNYGQIGHHEGDTTFGMIAGNNYLISIQFYPNVSGGFGFINGELEGSIDFKFGKSEVPEPAGIAIIGLGLLGLGFARRKAR